MTTRFVIVALLLSACVGQIDAGSNEHDLPPHDLPGDPPDDPPGDPIVQPSSADRFGGLEPTGLSVAPPTGTFDTDAQCTASSALGACTQIDGACVCRMDELTLGDLAITGTRALVILAYERIVVTGNLVVAPGAGTTSGYSTSAGSSGGAGGSFGSRGGHGAAMYGTEALIPLVGGMAGEDACTARPGGAGGGALQITAGLEIVINGSIVAGGGGGNGGSSASSCLDGAGGGSGGAILVEASSVKIAGGLAANGGGGGGGGSNFHGGGFSGSNGQLTDSASGGSGESGHGCILYGYTSGGWGGTGSSVTGSAGEGGSADSISGCLGGTQYLGHGGAGGGSGRIRINTETGCECGGTIAPAPTFGVLERS